MALITPEQTWTVKEVLEGFKGDTLSFVDDYFGGIESPEKRVIDFDEMIGIVKQMLEKIRKKRRSRG
jgi:hypothetical protein